MEGPAGHMLRNVVAKKIYKPRGGGRRGIKAVAGEMVCDIGVS